MIAGAGQCRRAARRAVLAPAGGARLHVHRRQDDARRPARPFLARGQAAVSRPRLRLRRDDPGRARAPRGDRRARVSRPGAGLAGGARPPLRQSGYRRLFPHRRRRRRPGGAAERHHRRRHPESQCGRGAEPGPARGLFGPACLARPRRTGCSTASSPARATTCSGTWRCSTRSTCACAPPRSWSTGAGRARTRFSPPRCELPFIDRIVLRAPSADALPAAHPAQAKIAAVSDAAAFVCVGETCSLPVTTPDAIAETVAAMWL